MAKDTDIVDDLVDDDLYFELNRQGENILPMHLENESLWERLRHCKDNEHVLSVKAENK